MGSELTPKETWQAFGQADDRVCNDTLIAKDAAAQPSSYTQAGSKPGVPAPDQETHMALEASGSQSEDGHLEVRVLRAGLPGAEEGGVGFRDVDAGDGTDDIKGHDGYQAVTGFQAIETNSTIRVLADLNVIRLNSGKLLVCGMNPNLVGDQRLYSYDPETSPDPWTLKECTLEGPYGGTPYQKGPALLQLPNGRVLFFTQTKEGDQLDVYQSDDDGDTWTIRASRILDTPLVDNNGDIPTIHRIRAAYKNGQIALVVWFREPTGSNIDDLSQFASTDLGCHFQRVAQSWYTDTNHAYRHPSIVALPAGGFLLVGFESLTQRYTARSIGSAFNKFSDAERVEIDLSGAAAIDVGCAAWLDEDGIVYVLLTIDTDPGIRYSYLVHRSRDGGATWEEFQALSAHFGDATNYLTQFDVASTGGRAMMCTRWAPNDESNIYAEWSVAAVPLGGFSRHTLPAISHATEDSFQDVDHIGWSLSNDATAAPGRLWIPIADPDTLTWSSSGAGTSTLTNPSTPAITTSAAQSLFYSEVTGTDADTIIAEFQVIVPSGQGDSSTAQIAVGVRLGDGATYEYFVTFRMEDGQAVVYDENAAASIGTITHDFTEKTAVRMIMSKGEFRCWYTTVEQDTHVREWTEGPADSVDDKAAAGGQDALIWGHIVSGANTSQWFMAAYCLYAGRWSPRFRSGTTDDPAADWENPRDIHPYSIPTAPALLYDGVKLKATAGPAHLDETFQIEALYDYGAENLDPWISPSPAQPWRSTSDAVEQTFNFDIGGGFTDEAFQQGFSIFVAMLGINFKTANLREWNPGAGPAAWETVMAMDASSGYSGLKYDRKGASFRPSSSEATTGARYLFKEDHTLDTLETDSAVGNDLHRIHHNTGGVWNGSGATAKVSTLQVEPGTILGTEDADGTCSIWRRNMAYVLHGFDHQFGKLQIQIPAQDTVDGYHQCGVLVVGFLSMLGRAPDWMIKWRRLRGIDRSESDSGRRRQRKVRSTRRALDIGWPHTVADMTNVRTASPSPDFYEAITGGTAYPVATPYDTIRQLEGVVERADSNPVPVVCFTNLTQRLTAGDHFEAQNDRSTWLYGQVMSELTREQMWGAEGVNELEKHANIAIEEEI